MSAEPVRVALQGHVQLRITNGSGAVLVVAELRSDLLVERGLAAESDVSHPQPGQVALKGRARGSSAIELRCPAGTDLVIGTLSGRVEVRGRAGAVLVGTTAGHIAVEEALTADLRTVSGSVSLGACSGRCRVATKSGRTSVGSAAEAEISSISGPVTVATGGDVRVRTTSGRVEVGAGSESEVAVQTLSGSVRVRLPSGTRPEARLRSLSSEPRCDCPPGDDCTVAVSSMSGKIEVVAE